MSDQEVFAGGTRVVETGVVETPVGGTGVGGTRVVETVGGPLDPVDPGRLLPRLAAEIPPGGRLELTVRTGGLTQELWEDLLVEAGFIVDEIVPVSVLDRGSPVLCRLIRARRRLTPPRPRVTSRP
ncbi:hypothetical protein GT042_35975, partial [Streptomyces sp. SID3212]|nr:hypothetical protein [Streptomyces sp. SID3212]